MKKTKMNRKIWIIIIALEIILAVGSIALFNNAEEDVNIIFTQEELLYNTGEAGFYIDGSYDNKQIFSPAFELTRGMYRVEILYDYAGAATMSLKYADGRLNTSVSGDIAVSSLQKSTCDFWVKHTDRPLYFCGRLKGDAADTDYLLVREIRIINSPLAARNFGFWMVIFLLIVDSVFALAFHRNKFSFSKESQQIGKALVVLAVCSSLPLMVDYLPSSMHDIQFHLMRIEGLKAGLENGMLPVRIQPNWMNGHGYATSVFYGDLFLYIPAILRMFGVSIQSSYQFYVLLVNTATIFSAYYCFSKMSSKWGGCACAALYSLNIYRLTCLYIRASVGEYTAMIFLPFILYGFWKIYTQPEGSEAHRKSWISIVFGCSGVFLSHMITCELVAVFVILLCLVMWKRTFSKKTFLVLIKSVLLIVIVNLWFLVPFLEYLLGGVYKINEPNNWVAYRLDERASFVAQLFMNDYNVLEGSLGHEGGAAREMPLTPGMAVWLLVGVWFVYYMGRKETKKLLKAEEYSCILFFILSVLLTTDLIPYTNLAKIIPFFKFPERSIQYPWRFLSMTVVFGAWLACIMLKNCSVDKKKRQILAAGVVSVAVWQAISLMSAVLNENGALRIYQEGNLTTFEVLGGEYLPVGSDPQNFLEELTYDSSALLVAEWHRQEDSICLELMNQTMEIQDVEVPFLYYKGYVAETENEQLKVAAGTSGRVTVKVPAGYAGSLTVHFEEPWYWRGCEFISLICLIGIIVSCFWENAKEVYSK